MSKKRESRQVGSGPKKLLKRTPEGRPDMLPEERALMPFADPHFSFHDLELNYRVAATAAEITGDDEWGSTDVEWDSLYHSERDAVLIRGRVAGKLLRVIAQHLNVLAIDAKRNELTTVEVAPQPWTNFQNSRGELVSWLPIPPGYRPVIQAAAERLGLSWPAIPSSTLPCGEVENCETRYSKPLLQTVKKSQVGLFRFSGETRDLAKCVMTVRGNWVAPYRIIVVVRTNQESKTLVQRLNDLRHALTPIKVGKIHVTTANRLHLSISVDATGQLSYIPGRTIILVADASIVGTHAAASALGCLPHIRMYGFLPRGAKPEPYVQHRIDAFFGLRTVDLHRMPDGGSPVIIVRQKNTHFPWHSANSSPLAVKKAAIWSNAQRNEIACSVATYFAAKVYSPPLNPDFFRLQASLPSKPSVVILVESELHLDSLKPLLPASWASVTVGADGDLVWQNGSLGHRKVVATFSALPSLSRFDVVVRADGGPGIPAGLLFRAGKNGRRQVLIDIWDHGRPPLRQWSRSRWEAYRVRGWVERPDRATELVSKLVAAAQEK